MLTVWVTASGGSQEDDMGGQLMALIIQWRGVGLRFRHCGLIQTLLTTVPMPQMVSHVLYWVANTAVAFISEWRFLNASHGWQ